MLSVNEKSMDTLAWFAFTPVLLFAFLLPIEFCSMFALPVIFDQFGYHSMPVVFFIPWVYIWWVAL